MLRVICVDSSNKPKKISPYEWITEGTVYTVVEISKMGLQAGKFGYKLKEVQLSEQSFPYEYYNADRFVPVEPLKQALKEERVEEISADLELV
jgi:hypothetical protein